MMDLSNFFSFFSHGKEEIKMKEDIENFKKTPYFKIGMFKKLIINGVNFKKSVALFLQNSNAGVDIQDIDLTGEVMIYYRGWVWMSQFDWANQEWIEDLKKSCDDELLVALKLSIHYFEEQTDYEKCAFLKKIQDFVEKYLEEQI